MIFYKLNDDKTVSEMGLEEYAERRLKSGNMVDRVAEHRCEEVYYLSTVLLPIEHPNGMLFETCLFMGDDSEILQRYKTYGEAADGHMHYLCVVEGLKNAHNLTMENVVNAGAADAEHE